MQMSFVIIEFICVQLLHMYSPTELPLEKNKITKSDKNQFAFYELRKLI